MYKYGGCEGQLDPEEAQLHQNGQGICRKAKMLPIQCTQQKINKIDLLANPTMPKSAHKPSSTKKAAREHISAKISGQKDVQHDHPTNVDTKSKSSPHSNRARTNSHSKPEKVRRAPRSCRSRDRSYGPLPPTHEPVFSATDTFVREPIPFAFVGQGSAARDEYDHPIQCRESDFSTDHPISYEDLRDKSLSSLRGFSPDYVLYPNTLLVEHENLW